MANDLPVSATTASASGWPQRSNRRWQFRLSSLLVLMLIVGAFSLWLREYVHNRPIAWVPYSAQALDQHRRDGHIVLVSVQADWDLTSQLNQKHAIETRQVRRFLREHRIVAMRADWTGPSAEVDGLLTSLQRRSCPLVAVFVPDPVSSPNLLPDEISEAQLLEALNAANEQRLGTPGK
jgi:thiol:disulfide interchange protein